MATKKSLSTGRFGSRYGTRIRKNVAEIEKVQKKKHPCPVCTYQRVKRVGSGIWLCKKCGAKFAGGAYKPKAGVAKIFAASEEMKKKESA